MRQEVRSYDLLNKNELQFPTKVRYSFPDHFHFQLDHSESVSSLLLGFEALNTEAGLLSIALTSVNSSIHGDIRHR